jgi:hypothetical protein
MILDSNNNLVIYAQNVVYTLQSTDNWATASIISTGVSAYTGGTTITERGTTIFLVHAHIGETVSAFEIEEIVRINSLPVDVINITQAKTGPEGIAWSSYHGGLLVSSALGAVYQVGTDGSLTDVDTNLLNPLGIEAADHLYITNSNTTAVFQLETEGFLAGVVVQDYATGNVIASVDLSAIPDRNTTHLANDVDVDPTTQDLYVTDSFGDQIWHLDSSNNYAASSLVRDIRFSGAGGPIPIGLNGIAFHPTQNYMIVGRTFPTGALFKVTPAGTVTTITVSPAGLDLTGADGIIFRTNLGNNLLVTVGNSTVYEFTSADNWATATLFRRGISRFTGGSTITSDFYDVYMTHPHLFDDKGFYEIDRIYFERYVGISPAPPMTTTQDTSEQTEPDDDSASAVVGFSSVVMLASAIIALW